MALYEQRVHKYVNSKGKDGFIRLFKGKCKSCGTSLFNVNEKAEDGKITAFFLCNCGAKFKQTMYSKELSQYKYPQGIVKNYKRKADLCRGVDFMALEGKAYLFLEDRIIAKEKKK